MSDDAVLYNNTGQAGADGARSVASALGATLSARRVTRWPNLDSDLEGRVGVGDVIRGDGPDDYAQMLLITPLTDGTSETIAHLVFDRLVAATPWPIARRRSDHRSATRGRVDRLTRRVLPTSGPRRAGQPGRAPDLRISDSRPRRAFSGHRWAMVTPIPGASAPDPVTAREARSRCRRAPGSIG